MRKEGQVISVPDPRISGPCPFSHVALVVKNPPAKAGDKREAVRSLGWKDPLKEGIETHSSNLPWRIPWTEEPGGLQSIGHKELDMTEVTEQKYCSSLGQLTLQFLFKLVALIIIW